MTLGFTLFHLVVLLTLAPFIWRGMQAAPLGIETPAFGR